MLNSCVNFTWFHVKDYEIAYSKPQEKNISYYLFLYSLPLVEFLKVHLV